MDIEIEQLAQKYQLVTQQKEKFQTASDTLE